ncbi:hypothetical protein EKO27_g11941, partial [Xylaria grammica]
MHYSNVLFLAAFAGTALSQKSDAEYCASKQSSFFSWVVAEGPTTPAAVLSYIATVTNSRPPLATFGPEAARRRRSAPSTRSCRPRCSPEFVTYIT